MKDFVLDTNVLISNPLAIHGFDDNNVIVPIEVVQELDGLKRRQDSVGQSARQASRELDALREKGKLHEGVHLPNGGFLRVDAGPHTPTFKSVDGYTTDHYILQCALENNATLITEDQLLRIMADALDVQVDRYQNTVVDSDGFYSPTPEVEITGAAMQFISDGGETIHPSQILSGPTSARYVQLKCPTHHGWSMLAQQVGGVLSTLTKRDKEVYGIRPLNREQRFALEALMDPTISLVCLAGKSGCGKTLLAMAAGLQQVETDRYAKMTVARPIVSMGNELGFLPGSQHEKLLPWMAPIRDSLDALVKPDRGYKKDNQKMSYETIDFLIERGIIELQALSYIRGRSLPGQFILIDECQQLSRHEIKTIVTRAGDGTKVVFTGDPYQIDSPYLDQYSNGMAVLIDAFQGQDCFASVTLHKGERSELAELAATLL